MQIEETGPFPRGVAMLVAFFGSRVVADDAEQDTHCLAVEHHPRRANKWASRSHHLSFLQPPGLMSLRFASLHSLRMSSEK